MSFDDLVADADELISFPRAYDRINEMLADPRYDTAEISAVIGHEPALCARVLRLANSVAQPLPRRIDSIQAAIQVLGTRALRDLLFATSVASAFTRINTQLLDVSDFWRHSVCCGILARLLGRRMQRSDDDLLFLAGLLHDLGKLVIYRSMPEEASEVVIAAISGGRPSHELELELLGFTHSQVGEALLRRWNLPPVLCEVAAYHHEPTRAVHHSTEVWLVHLANVLSQKLEPGHKLGREAMEMPALPAGLADHLALTPELIEQIQLTADVQSIEVFSTLFSGRRA